MTKEEKVARFQKMNQDIRKGQILCAGSSLMEMFPVEKFVKEEYPGTIIYNRGIGGYITNELLEHWMSVYSTCSRPAFLSISERMT